MKPTSRPVAVTFGVALLLAFGLSGLRGAPQQEEGKEPSVDEIVAKTNRVAYYQGKDGRARVSMTIDDGRGGIRERAFVILRRDDPAPADKADQYGEDEYCGDQKFYVYMEEPADVRKTVFMVWKHPTQDDDRWLYLPAIGLVKRIAAGDKRTSFVGSHFFYEDVSGRSIEADTHELVQTTDDYYVLKSTPRDPDTVEFSYFKMWIHKKTFVPVETRYYDKQDGEYRVYTARKVQMVQGYPTVVESVMQDLGTKGRTTLSYEDVQYDIDLPEDVFTERHLHRAPIQYLK